ncbi:hypothetical protein CIB84_007914 [Bambusicola thoracicus]|uniref:Cleavage and polyadenylation specificity factor subunit 2 n=1 Tax=Bambusicola thoracicus TaxID=9083 RepID=A0A2P4SW43_BAMTH|nr:hypothetical protein CIB84_007914 [Bambusicola thoracicus]
MTSIIKLTTLSGVQEESALCYLLQVDEFRFLLDCGWDENFSMDIIDSLKKHVHQVDAVLLSHPDPLHLGALPYAVGKMGLNCAIYATIPVYKMGQMFMYDLYQSRHNTEDFTLFTLDDVDAAFDKIQQLKFSQIVNLKANVLETLRGDGNVLIAVDTAGRVLELAQLLDQIWRTKDAGLGVYSLALLNNVSYNVVEFSKSQVEWMSDKLMRCFEDKRNNPFQFRHLSLCHSLSDLARVPSPKVVLASQPDLECGFSRDLFIQWCQDSKNSIILTYRTTPGTLARFLIDNPSEKVIDIELRRRVKLEGKELEEYLEKEKLKKEAAKKLEQSKEPEDFLVPELQATEEEKSKLESGLTNGEEPMDQDLSDVPTKCISATESMEIKARVTYIDYEGRSDGDSIKKIINQMKPRQLIIVHGPPEASQDLAECCRAFGGKDIKVYMPKLHETVDATSETHIYQVRLKDSLVSSLQFCKAKDAELAWIDGVLDMRVSKVDTGVILEEGELREDEELEMQVDMPSSDSSVIAQQKAMKSLFGDDDKEMCEESEIIPTLEPLPPHEILSFSASIIACNNGA